MRAFQYLWHLRLAFSSCFFATAGGYAALLWMMQWFKAKSFAKLPDKALTISYNLPWIVATVIMIILYAVVLGLGFRFT